MESAKFQDHLERLKLCKADADAFVAEVKRVADEPLTALQFMTRLGQFWNHEENKWASNSAMRRWINDGAVLWNGERCKHDEPIDFPISSLIMFPKSEKRRCTLV